MERLTKKLKSGTYVPKVPLYTMCDKLGEYEDLEEQGKLLKLPCRVGEVLYIPYSKPRYVKEVKVQNFMYAGSDLYIITDFAVLSRRDIGLVAFLTKEEAENELRKKEKMHEEEKEQSE